MKNQYIKFGCLASRLQLPKAYLRRLVESKKIPFLDMGSGRLLFKEQSVRIAIDEIEKQSLRPAQRQTLAGAAV